MIKVLLWLGTLEHTQASSRWQCGLKCAYLAGRNWLVAQPTPGWAVSASLGWVNGRGRDSTLELHCWTFTSYKNREND